MKLACIIAEYHPFHNAHARMTDRLHAMGYDTVAAVMSGNAVQRGVPALLPKEIRAQAALRCGMDLVLELPCRAAAAGARDFAGAGVQIAAAVGADALAFGAECADPDRLEAVCTALTSPQLPALLRQKLADGAPFYAARAAAAEALCPGAAALLQQPNNILATEYLCALRRLQQADPTRPLLRPVILPRTGAAHDGQPQDGIASAGWLRTQPVEAWQPYVPADAFELYRAAFTDGQVLDTDRWECAVLALLRTRTGEQLATLPDVSEGLDALLAEAIRTESTLEGIYAAVKSKRYTHARIRRLVLAAALGWTAEGADVPYLRVLGATEHGRAALGRITDTSALPVSSSLAGLQRLGGDCAAAALREAALGDLYSLCLRHPGPCGREYTLPFFKG